MALLGLTSSVATAEELTVAAANASAPDSERSNGKSLWLPQTRSEWDLLVSRQLDVRDFGMRIDGQSEDVTVTAPAMLPMHDVYDGMWTGILAPVWAIVHPAQAWRIFVPIPPN